MHIVIALSAIIAMFVVSLVFFITTSAIVFSRAALALVLATFMDSIELVQGNDMLNYIAWAMLIYGVIHFISYLPRANAAIQFFSTIVISVFLIYLIATILVALVGAFSGGASNFVLPAAGEIIIKIICFAIAGLGLLVNLQIGTYDMAKNPVVIMLERIFASLLYGVTILFLFMPLGNGWEIPSFVSVGIFVLTTVGTFIVDLKFAGKAIFTIPENIVKVFPK